MLLEPSSRQQKQTYQKSWYDLGMKVKTSVTLEADLLNRIDGLLIANETRSAFFQDAVIQLAEKRERDKRDAKDLELLNAHASKLNEEALENLTFVADIFSKETIDPP